MKLLKPLVLLIFCILAATLGCKDSRDVIPITSLNCTWKTYFTVNGTVIDVVTSVQQNDTAFVFVNPDPQKYAGASLWLACNMPDEAKKDQIKVKISGYLVGFPNIENSKFRHGRPFELIAIEYLK